jgi:hypothetical protein
MVSIRQFVSNTRLKKSSLRLKNRACVFGQVASAKNNGSVLRKRIMWRDFSRAVRALWRIPGEAGGAYRPDLHYMRGPGPKWHAKHAGFLATTRPAARTTRPTLHDIAQRRA